MRFKETFFSLIAVEGKFPGNQFKDWPQEVFSTVANLNGEFQGHLFGKEVPADLTFPTGGAGGFTFPNSGGIYFI
jgi:hypothetical protein